MTQDSFTNDEVENRQSTVRVSLPPLQQFLLDVKTELQLERARVAVCLVSDSEMARLNKTFRKVAGTTDVLSFPAVAGQKLLRFRQRKTVICGGSFLGDIAISPATAGRYAKENRRTLENELRILMLHGFLHLLGYDHESDHGAMNRLEQRLRRRLGIA
jgi:probable rRNA maturation factor